MLNTCNIISFCLWNKSTQPFLFLAFSGAAHHQIPDLWGEEGSMQRWLQCTWCCLLCVLVICSGIWTQRAGAFCPSDFQVICLLLCMVHSKNAFFYPDMVTESCIQEWVLIEKKSKWMISIIILAIRFQASFVFNLALATFFLSFNSASCFINGDHWYVQ